MKKTKIFAALLACSLAMAGCGRVAEKDAEKATAIDAATKEKIAFLESISGVYSFGPGGGTVAINYADSNMQMAFDGEPYSVRLGDVDVKGGTFNVLKRREGSNVDDITTIRKVWNAEKTAFKLEWTFTDGKTADVTFVRKFSSDDARRIASIGAEQVANAQKLAVPTTSQETQPSPAPVTLITPPQPVTHTEPTLSATHSKCITQADSSMPDMIQCSEDEAGRQDARLNAAYKVAMSTTANKEELRAAQRQWIKRRDKECADDGSGGQAAALNSAECIAIKTAARAAELEKMK